jgi:prevent-host-death family protein
MARTPAPTEIVMSLTDTKQNFSKVVNQVARGEARVVVEKSGAPVAAIISQHELREYERLKERDNQLRERLEASLMEFSAAFRDVPDEEFERVLAEAHREYREKTDREHGRV